MPCATLTPVRFVFGDLSLDVDRRELRNPSELVPLEPQAFDVLVHLVLHRDRVVPKEELMDTVWGGRFVSETAVTSRIKQVRRALGDDGHTQGLVRTYHGRGYRFVAPRVEVAETALAETEERRPSPAAPARRVDVPVLSWGERRFQLTGQGPPDLLLWPPVASLGAEWGDPERAALLTGLGDMCRVIRVESADTGAAAQDVGDLDGILDAAASERAVLFAEGSAADPVLRFASSHPDRCSGLVFLGASTGTSVDLGVVLPTLVLHRSGDPSQGRRLAAELPDAEFVALTEPSDVEQVLVAVRDLLEDRAAEEAARRSLTSLVGLSGGDLHALTAVLVGLGGRERRGPEDSVIVSFDGPASAFRALGSRRARGLVGEVGVGVAIDDVARESWLISGHGVDVARGFAGLASPGEVLFPNVIRDLLASSGLSWESLAEVDLPHVGPHPVHRWLRR